MGVANSRCFIWSVSGIEAGINSSVLHELFRWPMIQIRIAGTRLAFAYMMEKNSELGTVRCGMLGMSVLKVGAIIASFVTFLHFPPLPSEQQWRFSRRQR